MIDPYNIARYLPKRCLKDIKEISVDIDFDNQKNRTVQRYYIWFNDDSFIAENGIKNLQTKIKELYP